MEGTELCKRLLFLETAEAEGEMLACFRSLFSTALYIPRSHQEKETKVLFVKYRAAN